MEYKKAHCRKGGLRGPWKEKEWYKKSLEDCERENQRQYGVDKDLALISLERERERESFLGPTQYCPMD